MITLIVGIRHTYITHIFLFCLLLIEHLLNMQEVRVPLSVLKKKRETKAGNKSHLFAARNAWIFVEYGGYREKDCIGFHRLTQK